MLESLDLPIVKDVAQRQLAIEYNENICYVRVLIVDLLAPPGLNEFTLAEDHLERVEAHLFEPWVVQSHLFQEEILLGGFAHVHGDSVLVDDVFHDFVVLRVEDLVACHAA